MTNGNDIWPHVEGDIPAYDLDGKPVFFASGLLKIDGGYTLVPGKFTTDVDPHCRVSYGGKEHDLTGSFNFFRYLEYECEFVKPSDYKTIPPRAIRAGYELDPNQVTYHVLAEINYQGKTLHVPGKWGLHLLEWARVPFAGEELQTTNFKVLCYRK